MAVNKVTLSTGETLVDLTDATVTADDLLTGVTAYGASGEIVEGALDDFEGSTHGLVPAATSDDEGKFLCADGTWSTPSGGSGTETILTSRIYNVDFSESTTHTYAVTGILETDNPMVCIDVDNLTATLANTRKAFALVKSITTANNSITVEVSEEPDVSVPILLKVVR